MINPIIIIAAVGLILSAFAVAILNKPAVPVVTSTLIVILIFFVVTTYLIDSAISDSLSSFIGFSVLNDSPNGEDLEFAFNTLKYTDIGLFAASLISMFTEVLLILRQNSGK